MNEQAKSNWIQLEGDLFYKIEDYDKMAPFFMTLTSPADHWIFISSTGGLSAGRKNSDHASFPYYTDDRISENSENTGAKTIIRLRGADGATKLWEPFSEYSAGKYQITRNLYKNICGNRLIFEEINADLGLGFRYSWTSSPAYGLVKESWLENRGSASQKLEVLDGMQNILPSLVTTQVQNTFSVLLDAYKRSAIDVTSGTAILALNATLTDKAEPSEALLATTVWTSQEAEEHLCSVSQLRAFREGKTISTERDIKGKRCAYFSYKSYEIPAGGSENWLFCLEGGMSHSSLAKLLAEVNKDRKALTEAVRADIENARVELVRIASRGEGIQSGSDITATAHHQANVMFNLMRGGYFSTGYTISAADFVDFVACRRKELASKISEILSGHEKLSRSKLEMLIRDAKLSDEESTHSIRIFHEYLPLTFSRRHGDPSRPWNIFSINTRDKDGNAIVDYQGNWRDIFQNWEALLASYPEYIPHVIAVFLNAVTADGYNPYRIFRKGIDWEKPEPDNPWSNIGYWSDHQIIYLLKLLELYQEYYPEEYSKTLGQKIFVWADVPYRIKPYDEILKNYYSTIEFDYEHDDFITKRAEKLGNDGRLLHSTEGTLVYSTLMEKLIVLLLAKIANLVPDGGIWMNTQRPEWNDANNALVGAGISVVTLGYLHRYTNFIVSNIKSTEVENWEFDSKIAEWFSGASSVLSEYATQLGSKFSAEARKSFMDKMGNAASKYRSHLYKHSLGSTGRSSVSTKELLGFLGTVLQYSDAALRANKREDGLYHAYNTLDLKATSAEINYLYEMLEGQVSILSSGFLSPEEALEVLSAMEKSRLYRADQNSYMLYPDRDVPGFLEKNTVSAEAASTFKLAELAKTLPEGIIEIDCNGAWHFNSSFKNKFAMQEAITSLDEKTQNTLLDLYEETFNHKSFTGRSGTFFAYEGLGSIYWHMVSKLLLASQEQISQAAQASENADSTLIAKLIEKYHKIRDGIGYKKSAEVYGAFPIDPYSHTPREQGAKQPGMTGQVKEEVITRKLENGVIVGDGSIEFSSLLFESKECIETESSFYYFSIDEVDETIAVESGAFAFTFCSVPVIVRSDKGAKQSISLESKDGSSEEIAGLKLGKELSQKLFTRDHNIKAIRVQFGS